MKYYIGADIGGTNIACGIVDENGVIIEKSSVKTGAADGYDAVIARIADSVKSLAAKIPGNAAPDGVGVGCPGTCNRDGGVVEISPNLPGWRNVPLAADLARLAGLREIPIKIDNDANAAAYGEYMAGAAKGTDTAIVITLGTGVGSGIIIGGKLYSGMNFAGGEIGHIVIEYNGEPCQCGRRGCFEAYSSATGLIRMTKTAMAQNPDSLMHKVAEEAGKIGARTAWRAADLGDPAAQLVVDSYIKYLACGITNVINIFQPDIVCIGGGVCNEGDKLLIPLKREVAQQVYSRNSPKNTAIAVCSLGNDAGIIGAALLGK